MNTRKRTAAAFILACAIGATSAFAQDWPQWRGANRDAKANFTTPKEWPKELTQKWKTPVGDGVATPALVGDKVYVFSRQGNSEVLRCLNAADGTEVWKDQYESQGATGPAQGYSGPRSSPAVADGKVVTMGVRGVISCYTTEGKKLWSKNEFPNSFPQFFPSSSPIIVDGLVVVQAGGRNDGAIIAYDLATGNQKWKAPGDSPGYASPSLMVIDGVKLIVAETERRVIAVQAADGKLVWETPFAVQGRGYNASSPLVEGNTVIFGGSGRGTKAVELSKTAEGFKAKDLWSNPDNSVQFNSPVLKEGVLYSISAGGQFFAIDAKTGKTAWVGPAPAGGGGGGGGGRPGGGAPGGAAAGGAAAGGGGQGGGAGGGGGGRGGGGGGGGGRGGGGGGRGAGYGSIVDAGSVLIALTPSSEMVVLTPSATAYTEVAKIKVAPSPTYAYPVPSGDRILIKDQDSVMMLSTGG